MFVDVRPRYGKPAFGSVQVDWGHPLAGQLTWYYPFLEGGGNAQDVVTTFRFSTGSHTWKSTPKGLGASFDGTTNGFNADDLNQPYTAAFSVAALVVPRSASAVVANIASGGSGVPYGWQLRRDTAQWSFFLASGGLDNLAAEANGVTAGQPAFVVGTYDGSTMRLYRDAVLKASTATGVMRNAEALHVGYDNFGAPQRWDGEIVWLAWWKGRVLRNPEIAWLFAEPYAFLRPVPAVRYWSTPSAAAGLSVYGAATPDPGRHVPLLQRVP